MRSQQVHFPLRDIACIEVEHTKIGHSEWMIFDHHIRLFLTVLSIERPVELAQRRVRDLNHNTLSI